MIFKDKPRHSIIFQNKNGPCEEKDALIKLINYTTGVTEYFVRFYETGADAGFPVNPLVTNYTDRNQKLTWKKVRKEDCELYAEFLLRNGNYKRLLDVFMSRY